jgi:heterodisulfide reductase subunit C
MELSGLALQEGLTLRELVKRQSGEDVNLCYQCKKCTVGCPMSYAMDWTPTQLIHAIRLNLQELVFTSKTMWLCASCETCTNRCPQGLDIAKIMDVVKILALRQGIAPPLPEVLSFYRAALRNIKIFGRMHELGMIMDFKLRTKNFTKDFALGMRMFKKGKLKLLPSLSPLRTLTAWRIFSRSRRKEAQEA